jgi:hypothetical protein
MGTLGPDKAFAGPGTNGDLLTTHAERWRTPLEGGIILNMARKATPKRPSALDDARLRQQAIGAQLRQMFEDVVNEPIPTDFLDILRRADSEDADRD